MTNLVQRLRNWEHIYPEDQDEPDHCLYLKAADRIEELQSQIEEMHYAVTAAHFQGYTEGKQAAEDKLAKAVEAVKSIKSDMDDRDDNGAYLTCKYIIAKLEGDSDD